jgi:hypothetical protein
MKKLIITAACTVAALSSFAQGTIGFKNSVTTEFYTAIQDGAGNVTGSSVVAASSTAIDVGLFYSTSAFNTVAAGTLGGVVQMGTAAGQIAGSAAFTPAGVNAGDADFYQVFAWDASYGNTLAGLEACIAAKGLFGASSAGAANTIYGTIGNSIQLTANTPPGAGPPVFNTSGNSFGKTLIMVGTVPEPATIAIGGLGAAALLLFRRRK